MIDENLLQQDVIIIGEEEVERGWMMADDG